MPPISPQSCSPHPCQPGPPARQNWLARAASAVLSALREMDYAQRRVTAIRMSYNTVVPDPGKAPDTYQEFLLRTLAAPPHEPSARQRTAGRPVK